MTTNRGTKRALVMSILSFVVCVAMLVGTTFAWFTDTVSSTGNRIESGKLAVDFLMKTDAAGDYDSIANGTGDIFSDANNGNGVLWEPGKTEIVYLAVANTGTLDLKYNILLNVIDGGLVGALEYAIVDGAQYGDLASVADWATLKANAQTGNIAAGTTLAAPNGAIKAGAAMDYFALAVHMKEDAGVEYQEKYIEIDVAVQAGQLASELDSFSNKYDTLATFGNGFYLIERIEETVAPDTNNNFVYENDLGTFKASGIANEDVTVTVEPATTPEALVTIADVVSSTSYDIEVEGQVANSPVVIEMFIGKGLADVKLYHEGVLMDCDYNGLTGIVKFTTTSFSIYTVTYSDLGDFVRIENLSKLPKVETLKGQEYTLDAGYNFIAAETAAEAVASEYRYWHADFVVSFDKDVAAGTAGLAGQYDAFSSEWLAFNIFDVDKEDGFNGIKANAPLRLLKDGAKYFLDEEKDIFINYEELCDVVKEFKCGAYDIDGANAGTTMTVELRLYETYSMDEAFEVAGVHSINVETGKYKTVGRYTYTF